RSEPTTVATLQAFVAAESDAWMLVRTELRRFYERALASGQGTRPELPPPGDDTALLGQTPPAAIAAALGEAPDWARLLGKRVAELHTALTTDGTDPAFAPEPYTTLHQRGTYHGMRNVTR